MSNPRPRTTDGDRLGTLLGPLQWCLTPWGAIGVGMSGWILTAPLSSAPLAIGLCWWGVVLLLWAIQLERPWINVLPFPPLTVLALHLFLRWELGGMVLLISGHGPGDIQDWIAHVPQALPLNAVMTSGIVLAGLLNWRLIRRSKTPTSAAINNDSPHRGFNKQQLLLLGAITGVVAIGYIAVGFFAGTLDRGAAYFTWAGRFWRPDTLFSAAIRLRDLYFIVLPLLLWRWRRNLLTVMAFLLPTTASLAASALLGGRGLLLYPGLLTLGGLWLAQANPKLIRWLMLALCTLALSAIAVLPTMRHSETFQQSSTSDLKTRLGALRYGSEILQSSTAIPLIGRDLYAWSDPYLFREPGVSQPPAGSKRLSNLLFLWAPQAVMPDRPPINDGHLIAKEIKGSPDEGTQDGRHIWFPGVSLSADLYWRFRWPGVVLGSGIFGLLYAYFCRVWYQLADLNRSTATTLIALFPSTFLQGPPVRSLSETAWNWLYEFPKYALMLAAITVLIGLINRLWPAPAPSAENQPTRQ